MGGSIRGVRALGDHRDGSAPPIASLAQGLAVSQTPRWRAAMTIGVVSGVHCMGRRWASRVTAADGARRCAGSVARRDPVWLDIEVQSQAATLVALGALWIERGRRCLQPWRAGCSPCSFLTDALRVNAARISRHTGMKESGPCHQAVMGQRAPTSAAWRPWLNSNGQ